MTERCDSVLETVRLLSRPELDAVMQAVRARADALQREALLAFRPGDDVSFTGRNGEVLTGKLVKLNQKTASVRVPGPDPRFPAEWRVSPGLLKRVP